MSAVGRPLPSVTDIDTAGFFEAAARGELVVRACNACGTVIHLPRAFCDECRSFDTGWKTVRPSGHLFSYTVVERQVHPAFPVPHVAVLVEIDDAPGARLLGVIPGSPALTIGEPMAAYFEDLGDGTVVPNWRQANHGT